MNEKQLCQHFAGQALAGILASPSFSGVLMGMNKGASEDEIDTQARHFLTTVSGISWNIANQMMIEGRERGMIDP